MRYAGFILLILILLRTSAAQAHEVWIEPLQWRYDAGEQLQANLRNGQVFEGVDLSWNDRSTVLAEQRQDNKAVPLTGRLGDVPAFTINGLTDGLMTLIYQSGYSTVTYREFEKFTDFVTEKGYSDVVEEHVARDLPKAPIKEAYVRFAKSLIAVGEGQGEDAPRGLELEIVALDNPYTHSASNLRFQVLYRDVPLVENRVTVFARDLAGNVDTQELETSAAGIVQLKVSPGFTYLLDTVVLREPARDLVIETKGAMWESLWGSLTFRAPQAGQ